MKVILVFLIVCVSFAFASMDFQKASKEQLLSINGIGEKKANSIIEYRKTNMIKTIDDLKNIKGFGSKLISKIKLTQSTTKK